MQAATHKTFFSYLKQIDINHRQGLNKYIYKNETGMYVVLPKGSEVKTTHLQRQTFRDIVVNCVRQKESLPHHLETIDKLKHMSISKLINDDKKLFFSRLILLIADYAKNYYSGFGFRSSTSLAFQLIDEMAKKNPPPSVPTTPLKLTPPQRSRSLASNPESPSVKERKETFKKQLNFNNLTPEIPLEKKPRRKIDSTNATEAYIKNPFSCDQELKASVFLKMTEEKALHLLNQMQTAETKMRLLFDLVIHCNKSLAEEVIKKTDLSLSDISIGFKQLIKLKTEESGDLFTCIILRFIKFYDTKYLSLPQSNNPILPVTNEDVISVFCIALDRFQSCDHELLMYLKKLLKKEEFDINSFIKLICLFQQKPHVSSSKTMLIDHFKNSPKLQDDFKSHAEYHNLKTYFVQLGAVT